MGADGRRRVVTAHPKAEDPLDIGYLADLEHYLRPLGDTVADWKADASSADAAIVWDASEADTAPRGVEAIVADPLLTPGARDAVCRWVSRHVVTDKQVATDWQASLDALKSHLADRRLVLVGGGPLEDADTPEGAYAYLGSALLDTERTSAMPPSLVIAADSVGQFGTGRAARAFRREMRKAFATGAQLVVPQHLGPLAKVLFPNDADDIHVVPVGTHADRLWTTGRTRELGNVLTTLGLPLATALGVEWELVGVSKTAERSGRHWDAKADALAALENMTVEPASVAVAATEEYRAQHFSTLAESLSEMGTPSTTVANQRGRRLAGLVGIVDMAQAHVWPAVFGLGLVTGVLLAATAFGVLSASTFALAISVLALLAVVVVGLLLRQRLNRWQLKFERERRAMERRERRLVLDKLEELEGRLGPGVD